MVNQKALLSDENDLINLPTIVRWNIDTKGAIHLWTRPSRNHVSETAAYFPKWSTTYGYRSTSPEKQIQFPKLLAVYNSSDHSM